MKKLNLAFAIALLVSSAIWAENITITTTTSASADKVGEVTRPGLLFKFALPAELENARIDLAYLRFKVEADSGQEAIGLLIRPMLESWTSGQNLSTLSLSAASPFHANTGRIGYKTGTAKAEVTLTVKTWQKGELPNLGFLIYPTDETTASLQPKNLSGGGIAELEIFYTAAEKK